MRRTIALLLTMIMFCGVIPLNAPVYGADAQAGTRSELIRAIADQISQRRETFDIHYKGQQDLSRDNMLEEMTTFSGTELTTLLQTAYGLEAIEARYSYTTGRDILFRFTARYTYRAQEASRLEDTLQQWVHSHLSEDMDPAVKTAIVTRYLSDRLLYHLSTELNNAYDGFNAGKTACSGYAELTRLLLDKAGVPVRMIGGYIPDDLTETEYMSKRVTEGDFLALSVHPADLALSNLHVWNQVNVNGKWHHLDTTWVDGDAHGEPDAGGYNALFFLGSDEAFSRNHLWIRHEYPTAPESWWAGGNGPIRDFIKAYLQTRIYEYPQVASLQALEQYTREAYEAGRSSQDFRITQGVQPYDQLPGIGSMTARISGGRATFKSTPKASGDSYILTLFFKGRDADEMDRMPKMKDRLSVVRGDEFGPEAFLSNPEGVQWVSLSPTLISAANGSFKAIKEGRGYIGAYTRDEAVILPVTIEAPPLQVTWNDVLLPLNPPPVILEGRTLVPMRGIFEAVGASVDYNAETRVITGNRGDITLILTLGSKNAVINGNEVMLDVPPQVIDGRAFVPARVIAESFGASVQWDGLRNRVSMTLLEP